MKIKPFFHYLGLIAMLFILPGCDEANNSQLPVLTTEAISNIQPSHAISGGYITSEGGSSITEKGICWSINSNPTISDNKTIDGSGSASYVSEMNKLMENTTYYVRAYATNNFGTAYGNEVSFSTTTSVIVFNAALTYGFITDIDGKQYRTITVGSGGPTWMAENLSVTHYRNGDPIPNVTDQTEWSTLSTGAYCDYNFAPGNSATFGHMYNLFSIQDSRNIAPVGWHVPTQADWDNLITAMGGYAVAGATLKEIDTTHWSAPNLGATNSSGLTILPGGGGYDNGSFGGLYDLTWLWSSTTVPGNVDEPEDHGFYILLSYNSESIDFSSFGRGMCAGYVRCVMD